VWRGPPSRIAALTGVPTRTSIRTRGGTSSGRANRAPRIPGPRESAATPSPRLKPLRSRAERASVSPVPRQRALSLRSWLRPRCLLRRSTEVHRPRADYWSGRLQVADVALDGLPQRREAGATERRSNRRDTTALEREQTRRDEALEHGRDSWSSSYPGASATPTKTSAFARSGSERLAVQISTGRHWPACGRVLRWSSCPSRWCSSPARPRRSTLMPARPWRYP
jgi:hypothetical protein